MGQAVEHGRRHPLVAKDAAPFPEREIRGDDHRRVLVKAGEQVEQDIAASSRDREIPEFVEDDEVAPAQGVGQAPLPPVAVLAFQKVGQFDDVEEAAPGALTDTGPRHRHREMRLSGAGSTHENAIPIALDEVASGQPPHRRLVDRAVREGEFCQLLGVGQPSDRQLVLDRSGLLVGHFGLQQRAQHPSVPAAAAPGDEESLAGTRAPVLGDPGP